jgi:UDP-glucose 4-epimerase
MKTLVTGAHGFIGRYTVERLLAEGREVLAFDHQSDHALHRAWPDEVEVFLGDVRDATAVVEAMAHVDDWIHLAAVLGTQETIQNPRAATETNVFGGLNMFESASQYDLPGVYIAVGNHWMENTYSITKTCVERFARMYNVERGARINVVRALNAYGPRQLAAAPFGPGKVRKIMPAFICRAIGGLPVEVYGDGEQVMDMIYVEDVADCLVRALNYARDLGPLECPVECGTGRRTTVLQVAQRVVECVGGGVEITHLPMRPGEPEQSVVVADVSTMKPLGIQADDLISLEEGVRRTVEAFKLGLETGEWRLQETSA